SGPGRVPHARRAGRSDLQGGDGAPRYLARRAARAGPLHGRAHVRAFQEGLGRELWVCGRRKRDRVALEEPPFGCRRAKAALAWTTAPAELLVLQEADGGRSA